MKSMKIAMAAIIVAALMVIPIALFTVDDNQSEAAPDYQQLTDLMTDVNWELLMGLDYTKVSMTNNPDQVPDETVTDKTVSTYEFLSKNYKFSDGGKMVVNNGASVTICPTQGFSFGCASGWGTLTLKAGSSIVITSDGNAPTVANTIAEFPVQEDTSIAFQGRYAYDKGNWEFTFTIAKDSAFSNSAVAEQRAGQITFTAENKFVAKATINSGTDKTDVSASLKYEKIEYEIVSTEGGEAMKVKVNGNLDYNINVVAPTSPSSSQKDLNGSIKGNSSITVDLAGVYDATVKNNSDINVKVENFVDTLDDQKSDDNVKSYLNGSMSVEYSTSKGMDNYRPEGSDQAVTLKDASASYKMNFNNQDVNAEVNYNIGKFQITDYSEAGNTVQTIENLRVNGKYTGIIEMENANFPVLDAPASLSKAPSPKTIIDEYMNGVADKKSADDIKKYASEFFLGKFDQMTGMSSSGMTTKSLRAEVSIGKAAVSDYIIEGLNLNMEISESVGVKATGGFSKIVMNGGLATFVQAGKVTIGSTNVTVQTATDVDNKAMFNIDFGTSAEMKVYSNGSLMSSIYVKDFKGKATIATKNKMDSLTIGEFSNTVNGISATVSNITMDLETTTFKADEMKISGNYYGLADVKSVDGSYKNVTLSVQGFALIPTAESVTMRIDDLDGDHMDFTRTYDASKKVITNTYKVDGQMYLADLRTDETLWSLMHVDITNVDENATEVNVLEGGVLVPGGTYSELSSLPCLYVSGTEIDLKFSVIDEFKATAPGQVYVSTTYSNGESSGKGAMKIGNDIITLDLKGASVGVAVDKDGNVKYSLLALPGYKLSQDMTCSGITITNCNEKTADITISGTAVSCTANPVLYKIVIDGKTVKEEVPYGSSVTSVTGLANDVLYTVDSNGVIIGSVNSGTWSLGKLYLFAKDLDLKTVSGKEITTVETTKMNTVDAEAATFEVPAGGTSLQFTMSSKVRFDLAGLSEGNTVNLIAQKTNYNGHDGFIIKAERGPFDLASTVYIPVSGEGSKLMHVDEYGRVSELQADTVVIGDQTYLKAEVSDYSIFYADADVSPVVDNGGSGGISPVLIIVGIVAVVAVIGVAVFFVKKN